MKSFIKNTIKSILFVGLLIAMLLVLSTIFEPKNHAKPDGIQDFTANGILDEPKNTIDMVILGDSETYCAFMPLKIWHDYGITSYVCGTTAQKLCYSEEFLHKTFRKQNPKVVILETNTLYRDFKGRDVFSQNMEAWFSIFRHHNRWKYAIKGNSFTVNYTFDEAGKGYMYNTNVEAADDSLYMLESDDVAPVSEQNKTYLEKIAKYCNEKGAKLILVSSPSTKNWNYMRHNSVVLLAEDLGIEYIDMNTLQDEIPIDWNNDTRDQGDHMNAYGALKVSSYLGKYLAEIENIPDKRANDKYSEWNKIAADFNKNTFNCLDTYSLQ